MFEFVRPQPPIKSRLQRDPPVYITNRYFYAPFYLEPEPLECCRWDRRYVWSPARHAYQMTA